MWIAGMGALLSAVLLVICPKTRGDRGLWRQLLVVTLPVTLFFVTAALSPYRPRIVERWSMWCCAVGFSVLLLLSLAQVFRLRGHKSELTSSKPAWGFWLLAAVYSVLYLIDVRALPVWDAGLYFDALLRGIRAFDFSFVSFIDSFSSYWHPTHALNLLYAPAQYLFFGSAVALNLTTFALSIAMLYCYHGFMRKLFADRTLPALAATALFALMPHVFAFSTGINPDYGMLMALCFLLYGYSHKKTLITAAAALLLLFCKEPGILLYGGFGLGVIAFDILAKTRAAKSAKTLWTHTKPHLYLLLPLAVFVGYVLRFGFARLGDDQTIGSLFDGSQAGTLRFDFAHIKTIIKQLFVLNFNWLATLVIAAGILFFLFNKKRQAPSIFLGPFIAAVTVYIAFVLAYVEIDLLRYILPACALLPAAVVWATEQIAARVKPARTAPVLLLILFLISNYRTIDPVSRYAFPHRYDLGGTELLNTTNQFQFIYLCETGIYNRQYLNYAPLMDTIVRQNGSDPAQPYVVYNYPSFALQFFGNEDAVYPYDLAYSPSQGARVFYSGDGIAVYGYEIFGFDGLLALPDTIFWIQMPGQPAENEAALLALYDIRGEQTYTRGGIEITVYDCIRK